MRHDSMLRMLIRQPFLIVLIPVALLTQCAFASLICILPLYFAEEANAPNAFAGFVISGFALVETALKAFSGSLGDRYGRIKVMYVGLLIAICTTAIISAMSVLKLWVPFIIVHPAAGIGAAMIWTSLTALFLDIAPRESKAAALGIDNLCYLTGIVIGAASSFAVRHYFKSSTAVFIEAFVCFTCAIALLSCAAWHMKPTMRQPFTSPFEAGAATLKSLVQLCRNKSVLLLALILGLVQFAIAVQVPVLPIYAHVSLKLTDAQISASIFIIALVLSLLALPLSHLADLFPRPFIMRLALLIGAVAFVAAPKLKAITLIVVVGILTGAGWVMGLPAVLATIDDVASSAGRGLSIGFATTAQGIGFILGPSSGSLVMSHISMSAPFILSGVSLFIALAFSVMLGSRLPCKRAN
ncbi:MAG: MFS transporter [Armatimonadetes bacterium]|nr:MFS transporter [Armatimonadota bacterium]